MTFRQLFYVVIRNGLGAAFVNALLNGAIGWGITRGLADFPIWNVPGVAIDLVLTAFGITFGTCVVLPWQTTRDFRNGVVTLPALSRGVTDLLRRFPQGALRRGAVLGAMSVAVFAPAPLLALAAGGSASMARIPFVELKTIFSAVQGGLITPFVVLAILLDLSGGGEATAQPSLAEEPP